MNQPSLICGNVAHSRLRPKRNAFRYGIYYLALPLTELDSNQHNNLPLAIDRPGLISFHRKDHGPHDGSPLTPWARDILTAHGITKADGPITLVTMPRILGYVFNPISFWLCQDRQQALRAVICEVHNTFGETHSYLCHKDDQSIITPGDTLCAAKQFHVSPLLKREGSYRFQFNIQADHFSARINYRDATGTPTLTTSLIGKPTPLTRHSLRRAFWRYPLITIKAITLIHWQALKLLAKGLSYQMKPKQHRIRISTTGKKNLLSRPNNQGH